MAYSSAFADAISGIESGGRYGLLGPVTKSGDRAYGKYQVMGENVPSWTKQFYGESLTPQQFLANPAAQDAVFQGKFGQYANQYGPEGAAKAWFAGEGGMNNPNAKDMLGTTVQGYANRFTNNLGPSYAAVNSPPLTPGAQAPALPPPITIGGPPISGPQQQLPGAVPQTNQQAQLPGMGGFAPPQIDQPPMQAPPLPPNPIVQMAMLPQPPNTRALQQLLQNSAPVFRGLLS